jgi:hypothetical protein
LAGLRERYAIAGRKIHYVYVDAEISRFTDFDDHSGTMGLVCRTIQEIYGELRSGQKDQRPVRRQFLLFYPRSIEEIIDRRGFIK